MIRLVGTFFVCAVAIAACNREQAQPKPSPATLKTINVALSKSPAQAEQDLESRLAQALQVRDGIVILRDPVLGGMHASIFPANTTWTIDCGINFSIAFGNAVSSNASGAVRGTDLVLVTGIVPKETCDFVGPTFAKHLQAVLSGTSG